MSEELNKELENEVTEEVKEAAPMETMEDYAAELEASYKTLNQRHIEITEEESGAGAKWAQFAQMMEDRTVVKVKIAEAVKGGVVTSLEEVRAFIPASQLSTEYVEKLEDWQGKYVEAVIITVDPEKKRLVLSGREVEKEKKEAQKKERMAQFKAGDVVEGTVDSIKPYGAFIKLDDGVDAMVENPLPTRKHPAVIQFRVPKPMTKNNTATKTTSMRYSEARNALAPSAIASAISRILSVPGSSLTTCCLKMTANRSPSSPTTGTKNNICSIIPS